MSRIAKVKVSHHETARISQAFGNASAWPAPQAAISGWIWSLWVRDAIWESDATSRPHCTHTQRQQHPVCDLLSLSRFTEFAQWERVGCPGKLTPSEQARSKEKPNVTNALCLARKHRSRISARNFHPHTQLYTCIYSGAREIESRAGMTFHCVPLDEAPYLINSRASKVCVRVC